MTGFRLREQAQRHPNAILVAVALVLRLATLAWGVGLGPWSGWYHPNESKAWRSVVGFPGNYLSNRSFLYGTALQYTLGALLFPFKRLWHQGHPLAPSLTYVQFAVLALVGLVAGRAAPAARRVEWGVLAFIAAQILIWRGYFQPRFLLPLAPLLWCWP